MKPRYKLVLPAGPSTPKPRVRFSDVQKSKRADGDRLLERDGKRWRRVP